MIHLGDCLEVMPTLPENSVDSIVTDPPYGLAFMGKDWDHGVPGEHFWREALRVAKPGAHLLAFGGTRTFHRLACAIEDAGWEIRDCVMWVYGSGFPKSLDVSKAIDKAAGAERELTRPGVVQRNGYGDDWDTGSSESRPRYDCPATDAAKQWQGWGTALKPAVEYVVVAQKPLDIIGPDWRPVIVARKPLDGTVAENVLKWHTGALNIDGCRVAHASEADRASATPQGKVTAKSGALAGKTQHDGDRAEFDRPDTSKGRWPANVIHDGSQQVLELFPVTKSQSGGNRGRSQIWGSANGNQDRNGFDDTGSAARFFYCAKASKRDRDEGCEGLEEREAGVKNDSGRGFSEHDPMAKILRRNHHPTVKPTSLMRYLCRLVTPPGGTVLDPFMGSGSTGKAAKLEGFNFIGIEREREYCEIAERRIASV